MRSQPGLVVARPNRLAGPYALSCTRSALGSPVYLSVAVFAGCVGLGCAGILGAVIATLAVVALAIHTARYPAVRSYLDDQARLRERARRDRRRLRQLQQTGPVRIQHYAELRALVREVEQHDEAEAARFELQDLLDHWVKVAVDHQRCLDSLRLSGASELPAAPQLAEFTRSSRRREILKRRIRHRDDCARRMEQLADELAGVDELIRLVAQRTACPVLDGELDREIDRRLWELDEVDAAWHQLSA